MNTILVWQPIIIRKSNYSKFEDQLLTKSNTKIMIKVTYTLRRRFITNLFQPTGISSKYERMKQYVVMELTQSADC